MQLLTRECFSDDARFFKTEKRRNDDEEQTANEAVDESPRLRKAHMRCYQARGLPQNFFRLTDSNSFRVMRECLRSKVGRGLAANCFPLPLRFASPRALSQPPTFRRR